MENVCCDDGMFAWWRTRCMIYEITIPFLFFWWIRLATRKNDKRTTQIVHPPESFTRMVGLSQKHAHAFFNFHGGEWDTQSCY